ncbi:cinnamoyl-CoA reductase 1 [Artemisia annua]|uniref:Cinnamoyl-CoA reductase 1 n=1 Tax=Artemisia annua TaxID=35608 RepID=A0A2U1LKD9_ARTAN|nr:cinnamoyl-CoA reductase 1 [Artemisia annua]
MAVFYLQGICHCRRDGRFASQKWYPVSKTLAEKSAWEFAEKNGLDVVTILPSTCLGHLLQPTLNASCAVLQQLLQGSRNRFEGETQPGMVSCEVAAKRLIDTGMVFTTVEDAVKETVESLKSKRLLVS